MTALLHVTETGAAAAASAIGDLQSTTRGLLIPRMTTAQRVAISSPATSLLVYDTDLSALYIYIGGWVVVSGSGGGAPAAATYITQTANSGLSAEQALSTLSTGLMQVTTTTGVVSSVTTSAGIAALISDETGTGALVFAGSPTFTGNVTITGDAVTNPVFTMTNNDTGASPGNAFVTQASRNLTAVQTGDTIANFGGRGYGATTFGTALTGMIRFVAGENFTDALRGTYIEFRTTNIGTASPNIRMYLSDVGSLGIKVSAQSISNDIGIGGGSARSIGMERNATANTAGAALTVTSAGATSAATDKVGGAATFKSGIGTGNALPGAVTLTSDAMSETSGTTDHSQVRRLSVNHKVLTDNSAITIENAVLAAGTGIGVLIEYVIEVRDGTDMQIETGAVYVSGVNKAGAFTMTINELNSQQALSSAATLTTTWAVSSANPAAISVNANSSLSPSTGYPRISYIVKNLTQQAVTAA